VYTAKARFWLVTAWNILFFFPFPCVKNRIFPNRVPSMRIIVLQRRYDVRTYICIWYYTLDDEPIISDANDRRITSKSPLSCRLTTFGLGIGHATIVLLEAGRVYEWIFLGQAWYKCKYANGLKVHMEDNMFFWNILQEYESRYYSMYAVIVL